MQKLNAAKRLLAGAAVGVMSASSFAVTVLPTPVTDMFTTINDYVGLVFAAAIPIVALSVGLGVVVTLAKRFSKKV